MTVYKRSGARSWSVLVELRRDAQGRRRRGGPGGFRTKREAQARELAIKSDLANGTWVDHSSMTVGAYMLRWLDQHRHDIKPTTYQSYRANVGNHVIPHLGQIKLQELTAAHLNDFYTTLLTRGRVKNGPEQGGTLSRTPVRHIATIVGKSLQDALEAGLVVRNVARKPRGNRVAEKAASTWSASEVALFLESTSDDRLHPLWVVYATTGLRRGEALALRWEDVDLVRGQASIRHNLVVVQGGLEFGTPKAGRGRQISLAEQTVDVLRVWRRARRSSERLALRCWMVRFPRHRFHTGGWLAPRSGPSHRRLPPQSTEAHDPPADAPRAAPHLGNIGARGRRAAQGSQRKPRTLINTHHHGCLLPRSADHDR